jgi:threonine aldolase
VSAGKNFGSDNVAPVAPEIFEALVAANHGAVHSYGDDPYTQRLEAVAREVFETDLAIFPVTTGTAANSIALGALVPPYGGVFCHELAHIVTDECGAPEFYTGGAKLLTLASPDGKLRPEHLGAPIAHAREMGVHHVTPAALSLTQATEWGTVYTPDEVERLARAAHANELPVHVDGARLANALVHLGCTPAEATWRSVVAGGDQERRNGRGSDHLLRSEASDRRRAPAQARRTPVVQDALPECAARGVPE